MFPTPNTVKNGDGFYISYNHIDTEIYGNDTTALVIGNMERFHILNGDHRKEYHDLIAQGLDACIEYYKSKPELHNKRTEPLAG